jgi:very-short-patch-repair endonuclease
MTSPPAAARPLSLSGEGASDTGGVIVELSGEAGNVFGTMPTPSAHTAPSPVRERGRAAAGGEVGVARARTFIDPTWKAAASVARGSPTPSEARAWEILRDRRCLGLKFRREQIVDGLRLDLYCASLRLGLEIDGGVHDEPDRRAYDLIRTQTLNALRIQVLRVRNEDVSRETFEALLRPLLDGSRDEG